MIDTLLAVLFVLSQMWLAVAFVAAIAALFVVRDAP